MRNLARTLILLAILLNCITPSFAETGKQCVVLVTMEGISIDQLAEWHIPEFKALTESGSIGLMNDRSLGTLCFQNNAATISAGTRAMGIRTDEAKQAFDDASLAFNVSEKIGDETAGEVYQRNSGLSHGKCSIVHIGSPSIHSSNTDQYYTILPGKLGSELRNAGVQTYAFGNADHAGTPSRAAATIAMDENGLVDGGDISPRTLVHDPSRPFGVRTNYANILQGISSIGSHGSFVVVEAGDGGRIALAEPYLTPDRDDMFKKTAVTECCRFVMDLDKALQGKYRRHLIIFAVTSPDSAAALTGDLLTPITMIGPGVEKGLLTSQTTRRKGIVANYDITSTVLNFFGVRPDSSMLGRPISAVAPDAERYCPICGPSESESALSKIRDMNDRIVLTDVGRPALMKGYIYLILLVAIACVILLLPGINGRSRRAFSFLRPIVVGTMLVPLAFLIAPGFGVFGGWPTTVFTILTVFPCGLILDRLMPDTDALLAMVGIGTAAVVSVDLIHGAKLLEESILSYSVIAGARYYGIGNEYSGVLLGSILLGLFSILDRQSRRIKFPLLWLGIAYCAIFVLLGSPQFGTKFGGMVATIAGFSVAIVKMKGGKLFSRRSLLWAVGGVALLAIVIFLNMALAPSRQTHIGHIFTQAQIGGPGIIVETALRKWAMNFKLMRYSNWTISLIAMVAALITLCSRPIDAWSKLRSRHRPLSAGLSGIVAVAIVAFLTNDAGVVMASTTLVFVVFPLILLADDCTTSASET